MIYSTVEELPDWAKPIVERLIESGIIGYQSKFEFLLSDDTIRVLLILARLGLL